VASALVAFTVAACEASEQSGQSPASETTPSTGSGTTKLHETFTVARVIDGDTIDLDNGDRVRLVQIDAPEAKGECYGRKAGKVLRQLLPVGTTIRLVRDRKLDGTDRYGRLLRYVITGKKNVNLVLVRQGAASVWFYNGDRGRYAARLLSAARKAARTRTGAWGACEAELDPAGAFNPRPKVNEPPPQPPTAVPTTGGDCAEGYDPCLPVTGDLDCPDVEAMGLAPVRVTGSDPYRLDGDGDGVGCED
jgi:endonuclease YncB( thermonuclease family)